MALGVSWDPYVHGYRRTFWWPTVLHVRAVSDLLFYTYAVTSLLAATVVVVLAMRRYLLSRGLTRRELFPVLVAAVAVALAYIAGSVVEFVRGTEDIGWPLTFATNLIVLMIPVAFAASALRRRLDRSAVADLVLAIPQPTTVAAVRDALCKALIDPSLQVCVWLPDHRAYTDGTAILETLDGDGRLRREVTDARGGHLAVVLLDPTLERRADLVDAAVRAAALNLENARLHAELLAKLQELAQSRTRIVEAGVAQRRQVERDLHDGAQQQLIGVGMTLRSARLATPDHTPAAELLDEASGQLRDSITELRALARGLRPALLAERGLTVALAELRRRVPVPVTLTVELDRRLDPTTETTVYFVVAEALQNVSRHAPGARVDVTVRCENDTVIVQVGDDGPGGADHHLGSGLRGLVDRVAAAGGVMTVSSPAGHGTTIIARLPDGTQT